jgi:hypothetical protein
LAFPPVVGGGELAAGLTVPFGVGAGAGEGKSLGGGISVGLRY